MPENLNFNLSVAGSGKDHMGRQRKPFERPILLHHLVNWINSQNWDDYTKKELIKRASNYPHGGLQYFAEKIDIQAVDIANSRQEKTLKKESKNERRKDYRRRIDCETSECNERPIGSEDRSDAGRVGNDQEEGGSISGSSENAK
jgi:hypothetical protein